MKPIFSLHFRFLSLWSGRLILFHSETKYTSYTPTIPFLSFKIIQFESCKYLFHNLPRLFVYFIDFGMCVVNPNYTLPIPNFSLWSERQFSHGITSFSFVFYLFGVFYILKYHSSSRPFLLLLFFFIFFFLLSGMSAVYKFKPKVFFPHRLSSFRNKRHILYPNYTLSFNKLSCECAIVVLIPKIHFSSFNFLLIRNETHLFPSFSFSFPLKRETHPFSFRDKIHILYPNYTLPVFQDNSVWVV